MTAHRNESETVSDSAAQTSFSSVENDPIRCWTDEQSDHQMVANSVDHVLEIWSNVGLATLMAEIRGARVEEIAAILEDLAVAGTKAAIALRQARPPTN